MTSKQTIGAMALCVAAQAALAAPPVTTESGWSGFINLGVGAGESESNMVAAISSIDLGDDTVDSLDSSADSEDIALPVFPFEVAYTLGDSQTQFYLASRNDDYQGFNLDASLNTFIGIRQQISGVGQVDLALTTTPLATDVWKDPYITGTARGDTERTSTGLRMAWNNIMDSAFTVSYSSREIELDDEKSGVLGGLGLTETESRLLRREGNIRHFNAEYEWKINDRHTLSPTIGYHDYDLDGDAMAQDGMGLKLAHSYQLDRWRFESKLYYRELESSNSNPLYGKDQEVDIISATVTAFYPKPFGLENWTANATLTYTDEDSNIDFYDSNLAVFAIGMLYRLN